MEARRVGPRDTRKPGRRSKNRGQERLDARTRLACHADRECFMKFGEVLKDEQVLSVVDAKSFLIENAQVTMTFVEDKAVQIELPSSVVLTVSDAPDGIRGDSANNVQKTVTLETGITVQVPLFIKTGEKLKIDTRTGKYMERA